MSDLLLDHFTGTDGTNLTADTMNVGSGWVATNGNWTIQSNQAAPPSNTANAVNAADAGAADGVLTASLTLPSAVGYVVGIAARIVDASNMWFVAVERDSAGTPYLAIFDRSSGTNTIKATVNAPGALNTTATMTLTLNGTSIVAALSSGETCNFTSSLRQTATKHGVYGYTFSGYSTAIRIDDFRMATAGGVVTTSPRRSIPSSSSARRAIPA